MRPLLGTWPATQAYALTRNHTGNPLVLSLCSIHWATPARAQIDIFMSHMYREIQRPFYHIIKVSRAPLSNTKSNFHILNQHINPDLHYCLLKKESDLLGLDQFASKKFLINVSSQQEAERVRTWSNMWLQYPSFHWNKLLSTLVANGHFYIHAFWAFPLTIFSSLH